MSANHHALLLRLREFVAEQHKWTHDSHSCYGSESGLSYYYGDPAVLERIQSLLDDLDEAIKQEEQK